MLINEGGIKRVILADDDDDDRNFFSDALKEIDSNVTLLTVENGLELMKMLEGSGNQAPDLIFLDLNMPCKNGFECLEEIKQNEGLKYLPVIIVSTSRQPETINTVYKHGASFYIVKPNTFLLLKQVMQQVLSFNWTIPFSQPPREKFIINP